MSLPNRVAVRRAAIEAEYGVAHGHDRLKCQRWGLLKSWGYQSPLWVRWRRSWSSSIETGSLPTAHISATCGTSLGCRRRSSRAVPIASHRRPFRLAAGGELSLCREQISNPHARAASARSHAASVRARHDRGSPKQLLRDRHVSNAFRRSAASQAAHKETRGSAAASPAPEANRPIPLNALSRTLTAHAA